MDLSVNFSLEEFTRTNTGLPNIPGFVERENLQQLVTNVLQPARTMLGMPVTVTSGYRSPAVNAAVRGASTSQHVKGQAADLVCADNARLFEILKSTPFDQLIWEAGNDVQPAWVHVSFNGMMSRGQVLRMDNGQYYEV